MLVPKPMQYKLVTLFFAIGLSVPTGCVDDPEPNPSHQPDEAGPGEVLHSELERALADDVPDGDLIEAVEGNSQLAFEIFQILCDGDTAGNVFFSPLSITTALGMLYAGAEGDTETEMAEVLHFTLPEDRQHKALNALDLALSSRGEGAEGADGEGFRLVLSNRLWGQQGYPVLDSFLDALAVNYGAGMNLMDFANEPEPSREAINEWVSEQTEGRIPELLFQGSITSATRFVMTNAIYFNAAWLVEFDEEDTIDAPFYLNDGDTVTAPLMQLTEEFAYGEADDYQAIALPYDGEELEMVVLLPAAGQFDSFQDALSAERVDAIIGDMMVGEVELSLPRFEYTSEFILNNTLQALGMTDVFQAGRANLSGIDGTMSLFVSLVIHKAFVLVNESGTEAAAATAVVVDFGTAEPTSVVMTVDRPFFFLIRDVPTGAVLFVGRVMNPLG